MGYRVITETDSSKALELFVRSPGEFDLVITDQSMPNLSGLDLAEKMLNIRPDIPIPSRGSRVVWLQLNFDF